MLWHAMPPEVTTARLMAGAGPAPMLQSAAGWQTLSMALQVQAADLAVSLRSLGEAWTGTGSETALAAAIPMVAWLETAAGLAQARAARATAQAAAYTQALASTPSLPEIAQNHITTAVLTATNFLGINLVPIAFNEMDYFVRMWTQAAVAMDVYQAQTVANTAFEKLEPMTSILVPMVGATMSTEALSNLSDLASAAATLITPISQAMSSMGQMQQLTQPLTQLTSSSTPLGSARVDNVEGEGEEEPGQMGLLGASPLSNHPVLGGTGPSMGSGLLRAEALPGAGATPTRTPLMSQLVDKAAITTGAGAGSSATGGAAPMGMAGQGAQNATARPGLVAVAPFAPAQDELMADEMDDDW